MVSGTNGPRLSSWKRGAGLGCFDAYNYFCCPHTYSLHLVHLVAHFSATSFERLGFPSRAKTKNNYTGKVREWLHREGLHSRENHNHTVL